MKNERLVPLDEVARVLGYASLDEPPGWRVHQDWAGRPALTESDAAQFVSEWRRAAADAQAEAEERQERVNARRRDEELLRQRSEALESALVYREARRRKAIREGMIEGRRSVHGGLIEENAEEEAAARGGVEAALRFDRENPLPSELPS